MDSVKNRLCVCMIEGMVIYLFGAGVRSCALVNDASDVLNETVLLVFSQLSPSARVFSDCGNIEFVSFDVGGVFVFVECSVFPLSGCGMFCKRVELVCRML